MDKKKDMKYSGIGGQAVLEGIMMKNKDQYAVAVRKPDGEIEVEVEHYVGIMHGSKLMDIPFIRGIFQFVDSLILGMRSLNFSASFYEDEEAKETAADRVFNKLFKGMSFDILHYYIVNIVIITYIIDIDNIWMRKLS